MSDSGSPPPPPDYSGVAAASEKSAELSFQLGQEQLAWAKEQFATNKETSDKVIDQALSTMKTNATNAAADRARYQSTFQPLEDQLVHDSETFASEGRKEQDAGRAQADVSRQFQAARDNAQQRLEQFGVDPSQTRAGALDMSIRMNEAASRASAGNQARQQDDAIARAMRSEAINVGRGYPGQIAQTYGTALGAGNQAVNSGLATTATGAQTMGTPTQWTGLGNQSLGVWGNALTQGYNTQMQAYNAEHNQSSGIGSILGAGLGLATMFLEEGGPVDEGAAQAPQAPQAPQDPARHQGIPVSASLSPSGGQETDDIPARLNAGEYIIPKDVVAWKGQEFFQKLIDGTRKQDSEATAKPRVQALPAQAPALRTALPTG